MGDRLTKLMEIMMRITMLIKIENSLKLSGTRLIKTYKSTMGREVGDNLLEVLFQEMASVSVCISARAFFVACSTCSSFQPTMIGSSQF